MKLLESISLPTPQAEFKFHPERKWTVDFAWPEYRLALEVEGGIWIKGRHTTGTGFAEDMEKYNALACTGWRLVRVVPSKLLTNSTIQLITAALQTA